MPTPLFVAVMIACVVAGVLLVFTAIEFPLFQVFALAIIAAVSGGFVICHFCDKEEPR